MDEGRSFLSVIIPIHSYFVEKKTQTNREDAYTKQIISVLKDNMLTITELSKALGYKAISKKLRTTLDDLVMNKTVEKIIDGRNIKYRYRRM